MIKSLLSIVMLFASVLTGHVMAQTARIYVDDFTIHPGESKVMNVMFEADVYVTQAQFFIDLPESGFEFENKGTTRRPVYGTTTDNSAGLTWNSNIIGKQLRVVLSDMEQIGTEEMSGELAYVYIKADNDVAAGEYVFKMTNVAASDENASNMMTPDAEVRVTVTSDTTGLLQISDCCRKDEVYTITGSKLSVSDRRQLPAGIYIVNGKKFIAR